MNSDDRDETLDVFTNYTGVEGLARVIQRGRDPQTARFSFEMTDGRTIRIGSINALWSQAELAKALAVTIGQVLLPVKTNDWRRLIGAIVRHATDIEEATDQTLADRLVDWLDQYVDGAATSDRDGAIPHRMPFTLDGELWLHPGHLTSWVRRQYGEQVADNDIRDALTDVGFVSARVSFNETGAGKTRRRTTARYRRGPIDLLDANRDD